MIYIGPHSTFKLFLGELGALLTGSIVGHRSIAPGFKLQPGYIRRVFHVSLRLITIGSCSAHLAYLVHKSGCNTAKCLG